MFGTMIVALAGAAQEPAPSGAASAGAKGEMIDVVAEQARQPAVLINQGVTLARQGRTTEARALFEAVKAMKVDYTLETLEGRWVYPPDLARKAIGMLDRGEFAATEFALRD